MAHVELFHNCGSLLLLVNFIGSCQLIPDVPEGGYCVGEEEVFSCTRRIGTISGTTYDNLEWDIAESANTTQTLGRIAFIAGVHSPGMTSTLSFMGRVLQATLTFVNSSIIQSTLRVTVVPELNNLIIRCHGGGLVSLTSNIMVTSELSSHRLQVFMIFFSTVDRFTTIIPSICTTEKLSKQQ